MNEPKKKIDHMVFNVRNLEEAVRFYTEVVGMKVVMRFDDRKMAFLSFGDRLGDIRLFETGATADPDRQTHGFNHVAFAARRRPARTRAVAPSADRQRCQDRSPGGARRRPAQERLFLRSGRQSTRILLGKSRLAG